MKFNEQSKKEAIKKPSLLMMLLEGRTVAELGLFVAGYPILKTLPKGDGHPVIVIPGFTADDTTTIPIRHFLKDRGYAAHPWGFGRNLANEAIELRLIRRIKELKNRYNEKVSIIGWSLGGVYAREVARLIPGDVRQVITMGSPFGCVNKNNNAILMYRLIHGMTPEKKIDPELIERMKQPIDVPSTAIYSKSDGIVPWQYCMEQAGAPNSENIEVVSSHCGLGHHPVVLMLIANRLAQAKGAWQPFEPAGYQKWLYPEVA